MARWTQDRADIERMARVGREVGGCLFVDSIIEMIDKQQFRGAVVSFNVGNNGPQAPGRGPTSWYGECTLETPDGSLVIDYLDIQRAMAIGKLQ